MSVSEPSFRPTPSSEIALREAGDEHDLHALLTVDDVAALLNVEKSWVYEHTRSRGTQRADRLPTIKLGKYVRFEPRAIQAYLANKAKNR